jgi:hypothetical protein
MQCRLPFINHRCELGGPTNLVPCRNLCERIAVRGHNGSLYDKGMKYCPKCAIFFRSDEKTHFFAVVKSLELEPVIAGQGIEIDVQSVIEN